MIIQSQKIALFVLCAASLFPALAFAHQPRITESRLTEVPSPEISKAYYGKLTGEPDVYVIKATEAFDLYVNILVPDIAEQKKGCFGGYFEGCAGRPRHGRIGAGRFP